MDSHSIHVAPGGVHPSGTPEAGEKLFYPGNLHIAEKLGKLQLTLNRKERGRLFDLLKKLRI